MGQSLYHSILYGLAESYRSPYPTGQLRRNQCLTDWLAQYIQWITPIVNCLARLGNIPIVDGQVSQVVVPITDCLARLGSIPIVDGQASQVAASITDCLAKLCSVPIADG